MAEHLDPADLDRPQGSDQRKQGGFPGARGTRHHDELARSDLDPIVDQGLRDAP
jgi:hypothetical protein